MRVKTLVSGLDFPEGLRWREGRLWFSDMNAGKVMAVNLAGNLETILHLPGPCSGLGWLPDGRLLVVAMHDRCLLRLDPDGLVVAADLIDLASWHCNDMVVDGKGRAYIGNFGSELKQHEIPQPAELILVTPEGHARVVADNMAFPNGAVITPDGKTLIVGETYGGCLTAFDIDTDGSLSDRRTWASFVDAVPDGLCLDVENAVWAASPISREVVRVHEGGRVSQRIKFKQNVYACMLGGDEKRILFVATSSGVPGSGQIDMVPVDVAGAGLP
jgi:sugar lactone lactonase YvrE